MCMSGEAVWKQSGSILLNKNTGVTITETNAWKALIGSGLIKKLAFFFNFEFLGPSREF